MQIIKLSSGQEAKIDDSDFALVQTFSPWLFVHGYALTLLPNGSKMSMHRLIMTAELRQAKGGKRLVVDHINRNKLDNRRENLRVVTDAVNLMNRTKTKLNQSGYKGVYPNSVNKLRPWCAQIPFNGQQVYLGRFATKEEAALTYNAAAIVLRGTHAVLNELEGNLPIKEVTQRLKPHQETQETENLFDQF